MIYALPALTCVCGCVTHAPETDPAPVFAMPEAFTAGAGDPIAEDLWWTHFNDPVLTGLIESALNNNLTLAQALVRINLAHAFVDQARAGRLPQIGVDADAERRWERLLDLDTSDKPTDLDE